MTEALSKYLPAIYQSLYSKEIYSEAGHKWKGFGLLYIVVLLAVLWIPITWDTRSSLVEYRQEYLPQLLQQIPEITINKGEVRASVSQPYYIKNPENGKDLAIIDTTGKVKTLAMSDAYILLRKNDVLLRKDRAQTETQSLAMVDDYRVNSSIVEDWVNSISFWFPLAVYGLGIASSFLYRAVTLLLFTVLGLLIARWIKLEFNFESVMRVTAIAITPSVLLNTVLMTGLKSGPLEPLFEMILVLGYLYFGLSSCAEVAKDEPEVLG